MLQFTTTSVGAETTSWTRAGYKTSPWFFELQNNKPLITKSIISEMKKRCAGFVTWSYAGTLEAKPCPCHKKGQYNSWQPCWRQISPDNSKLLVTSLHIYLSPSAHRECATANVDISSRWPTLKRALRDLYAFLVAWLSLLHFWKAADVMKE